jgi:hypothetical protein
VTLGALVDSCPPKAPRVVVSGPLRAGTDAGERRAGTDAVGPTAGPE